MGSYIVLMVRPRFILTPMASNGRKYGHKMASIIVKMGLLLCLNNIQFHKARQP